MILLIGPFQGHPVYLKISKIRDFGDFSNFADFSRKIGKSYRQTVFFIVLCVLALVFSRKNLNHLVNRFSKKSTFYLSSMSESEILTIFQTSPIFLEKLVRAIAKRFS